MKLTESKLKQIIKEELQKVLVAEQLPPTFSEKEILDAIPGAMKAIMQDAGARNLSDFMNKVSSRDERRKEFRKLFNLRKGLKAGKVKAADVLKTLGDMGALRTALGVTPVGPGAEISVRPEIDPEAEQAAALARAGKIVPKRRQRMAGGEFDPSKGARERSKFDSAGIGDAGTDDVKFTRKKQVRLPKPERGTAGGLQIPGTGTTRR